MDIWSAANGGSSLDIRVARDDVAWLKQLGLHCITVHDSVEELVRKFEENLSNVKQEWFEEYVSHSKGKMINMHDVYMSSVYNSIHMMTL